MMPFMPSPEEFAKMQEQAAALHRAEGLAALRHYTMICRHSWITCSCSMFASRDDYWAALGNCPVHGAFIIATEEIVKEVRGESYPHQAA